MDINSDLSGCLWEMGVVVDTGEIATDGWKSGLAGVVMS